MNIDEAIPKLKELVEHNYLEDVYYLREDNDYIIFNQAIETLINEYNNLKQIEEAHRLENGELRTKISELEREINGLKQTFTIHDDIDNHIPHID